MKEKAPYTDKRTLIEIMAHKRRRKKGGGKA